jgi:general transcription factor 3C polypeptide 2
LTNEFNWLLLHISATIVQDRCYSIYGSGIHSVLADNLGFKVYCTSYGKSTVLRLSGPTWLGTIAAGDIYGKLIAAVFTDIKSKPKNVWRPAQRRFSIYEADLVPYEDSPEGQDQCFPFSGSTTLLS